MRKYQIWFWQSIQSPHMGSLASALADRGYKVVFVSNQILSQDRLEQGWEKAKLGRAKLKLAKNKRETIRLAKKAPKNSIHFSQGLRGNHLVAHAQKILKQRKLRHWAMLEKINDNGFKGKIRRILYRILFLYWRKHLEGILAIGHGTREWIVERGMQKKYVISFAYFLKKPRINKVLKFSKNNIKNSRYRFIFVGQLIKRKNLDLLIKAIASLKNKKIELWVVGDGPEKENLYSTSNLLIPGQVHWFGSQQMSKISEIINQVDCLVLPSYHDGWGAVVSEALLIGIPVICSDTCGSSVIVKASGFGGIFPSNNQKVLSKMLHKQYKSGKLSENTKQKIASWARCVGAKSGAEYLDQIINIKQNNFDKEPWEKNEL